jgi:hypothetical protein
LPCLPSHCPAMIVGDTDIPTDSLLMQHRPYRKWRLQQFYCCVYSLPWEHVCQAVA